MRRHRHPQDDATSFEIPIVRRHEEPTSEPVTFTYKASHHDRGGSAWLAQAVGSFFAEDLIDDVLASIKGGKEATVYRCRAHASTGVALLAAKVYRPSKHRSLKNDAVYREGRGIIGDDGKTINARDRRVARAVQKMTQFGQELRIGSWIGHEYETLELLGNAGIDVPRCYAMGDGAILMEYLGDEEHAAPTLNDVSLELSEARMLFDRVMSNVEGMLACHRVHADLSAYNILYWDGAIRIIDLPQAVDPRVNRHAESLFLRDVVRVCQYFRRQGVETDAESRAADIWSRYTQAEL
jgi:serine/threonine-protein kinase RIO1